MKQFWQRCFLAFWVLSWTVGCDQVTKRVAEQTLQHKPIFSMLYDTFRLQYVQNSAAFLGFGSWFSTTLKIWVFLWMPCFVLCIAVVWGIFSKNKTKMGLFWLMLIVGGGVGNLIDRFFLGKVTDFMNIGLGSLRTGIFNAADVFIMIGTVGFAIAMWMQKNTSQTIFLENSKKIQ